MFVLCVVCVSVVSRLLLFKKADIDRNGDDSDFLRLRENGNRNRVFTRSSKHRAAGSTFCNN